MKTILVTGFEPFDGSTLNPSQQVALALDGQSFADSRVTSVTLPVDRVGGPQTLLQTISERRPDAVVCLGEAARRMVVSVERVALNLEDYRIPDNQGQQVSDLPIVADGPVAYFSTLPVRAIYDTILAAGIPVELSLSAGAFLCNQVFYSGRHFVAQSENPIPFGFIHLPALPEQAATATPVYASMSFETSLRAICLALETIAKDL